MPAMNVILNLTATAIMNLKESPVYVLQRPARCMHFSIYECSLPLIFKTN